MGTGERAEVVRHMLTSHWSTCSGLPTLESGGSRSSEFELGLSELGPSGPPLPQVLGEGCGWKQASAAFRWRFWEFESCAEASWVLQKITEIQGCER